MHVKFMSYKIDKIISEELIRNIFSVYGEVCDTTIKQISIDKVGSPITVCYTCLPVRLLTMIPVICFCARTTEEPQAEGLRFRQLL